MMLRSPSKSDGNINELVEDSAADNSLITPPSYVFARNKTKSCENNLSKEFAEFKSEMKCMFNDWIIQQENQLTKITPTLLTIQQSNSSIENSITFMSAQFDEMKRKIDSMEIERKKDKEYIIILEDRIEELQRGSRKTCVELKNVPKLPNETKENLVGIMLQLATSTGASLSKGEIKDIYRVQGKPDSNKSIITELSSTIIKNELLRVTKKFNATNKNAKLNASHLGFQNNHSPVFLVEQLTPKASWLYYLARDLARVKGYKYCWTSYGKVYLRKDDSSPIIQLKNETQITSLKNKD